MLGIFKRFARYYRILLVIPVLFWVVCFGVSNVFGNLGNLALLYFLTGSSEAKLSHLAQARNRLTISSHAYSTTRFQEQLHHVTFLMDRYSDVYFAAPVEALNTFREGLIHQNASKLEDAVRAYQQTIDLNAFYVPAYYKLWQSYVSINQEAEATLVVEELYKLIPQNIVHWANTNGVTLTGYSLDKIYIETTLIFPLVLYWQNEFPICARDEIILRKVNDDEFYCIGDRLYQVTMIENLAPVGDEIYKLDFLELMRYQSGCEGQACSQHILTARRGAIDTKVFALINRSDVNNALISPTIAVEPDTTYLLSAWIKVHQGKGSPRFGVVCFGQRWSEGQRYMYIMKQKDVPEWEHFGGLVHTNADEYNCRVLLLNYADASEVYFDDIMFGQLSVPQS